MNNTQDGQTSTDGYVNPNGASSSDAVAGRCSDSGANPAGTTDCTNVLPDVSKTKSMYFLIDVCGNEAIVEPSIPCSSTGPRSASNPCTLINDEALNNDQWKEFRITPCKTYDNANP